MKLARMLMVRKDSRHTAIDMLWHEQEGLDALIRLHCIFDSLSHVRATIGCFQTHSIKWAPLWKGAKKPLQIIAIHDRKHPARRPLVNSALDAATSVRRSALFDPMMRLPSRAPRLGAQARGGGRGGSRRSRSASTSRRSPGLIGTAAIEG